MSRNKTSEPVKYLVECGKGDFVIEIPANWRLTFGMVNPGAGDGRGFDRSLHCLRIWEGEKLRSVHCDVRGFRDLSIPLARKVEVQTGTANWTMDSAGNFDESRSVKVEHRIEAADDDRPF